MPAYAGHEVSCNRVCSGVIWGILNCVCLIAAQAWVELAESSSAGENLRPLASALGATLIRTIPPSVKKAITLS
jgi:hypothetical protein